MKNIVKKIYAVLAIIALGVTMSSCSDWLNYTPKDKQSEEQQFATKSGIYAAVNGIYNQMSTSDLYGKNLSYEFIDILGQRYEVNQTDETGYAKYCRALVAYDYTESTVESTIAAIWSKAYHVIMNINVVLKNLDADQAADGSHVLTEDDYKMLRGEMLACRAMLHFDMLRLFGPACTLSPEGRGIPYNESTDTQILPILTVSDVLNNYIIRDIEDAKTLLAATDPVIEFGPRAEYGEDSDDNSKRYRQLRLNYYAVTLLAARAYQWGGNNAEAYNNAIALVEDANVQKYFPPVDAGTLLGNTTTPDRMFTTECLFGFYNDDRGLIYDYHFGQENSGRSLLVPRAGYVDEQLFSGADVGDYRYQSQWENGTTLDGDATKRFLKYKDIADENRDVVSGSTSDENEILKAQKFYGTFCSAMKLSEAYYIASETAMALGKELQGWILLNEMRKRRGVPELDPSYDYVDVMTKEYIREYIGEGQVFFYFKRLNKSFDNVYNGQKRIEIAIMPPFIYSDKEEVSEEKKMQRYTLPLPKSETDNR